MRRSPVEIERDLFVKGLKIEDGEVRIHLRDRFAHCRLYRLRFAGNVKLDDVSPTSERISLWGLGEGQEEGGVGRAARILILRVFHDANDFVIAAMMRFEHPKAMAY